MPLVTRSYVQRADLLGPRKVDGLINALIRRLAAEAHAELGPQDLIARDLLPGDLPGDSNHDWLETTGGSDNTWVASANGDGTVIAIDTWLGIYGYKWVQAEEADGEDGADTPPVTAIRHIVASTTVAQWDLYRGFTSVAESTTPANTLGPAIDYPTMIAESPVIVGPSQIYEVDFYEIEGTLDFRIQLLGVVVEKRGVNINP